MTMPMAPNVNSIGPVKIACNPQVSNTPAKNANGAAETYWLIRSSVMMAFLKHPALGPHVSYIHFRTTEHSSDVD